MFKIITSLTIAAFLLLPLIKAQEKATLRFLSFPKAADPEPLELVVGEGQTIKVNIPTNRISEAYEIPLLSTWALGRTIEGEEGEPEFKVLGKTKSLSKNKQLILIIRNGFGNDNGLKLIAMPNDESKIGGGTFFFLNAAPDYEIAGKVTESQFSLKPGKSAIIKPDPSKVKGRYKYCEAMLAYRKDGETRPFYTQTWRLNDKARNFVFFYQDSKTQKLKLHIIRDYVF